MVMQTLIDALNNENWQAEESLIRKVNELKSACLELGGLGTDGQESIDEAKELWNIVVARSNIDASLNTQRIKFLAACRELAFLTLNLKLKKPWDDKTTVNLLEMTTRLVRAFSQAKDIGKARLYLSKSAELYDELNRLPFAAPWLQVQIQNCLIVFHAEKAKLALGNGQQELNLIIDEAMDTIKPPYLSHYVADMINMLHNSDPKELLPIMERIYERIRPIEDFPAHISDDVLFLLIDLCLIQGQKTKLELAGGYLNMVTLRSKKFYAAKIKYMLLTDGTVDEIAKPMMRYAENGASLPFFFEMILATKPVYFDACLAKLNAVDIRTFGPEVRSDLVGTNIMRMVTTASSTSLIMNYTSDHLSFLLPETLTRLQRFLFEKAEAARVNRRYEEALSHLQLGQTLFGDKSKLDNRNAPVLKRLMVQCLLDLKRFDETEQMLVGMPFDLHGITLRFLLAVGMKKENDAIRYVNELAKQPDVTLNHLLSLANRCKESSQYATLASVFTATISRFQVETVSPKLKLQILSSAAFIASQTMQGSLAEKAHLVCSYSSKALAIIQSDAEVEAVDLFFSIAWNTAVEAGREGVFCDSAVLFHISYLILSSGRFKSDLKLNHAKIACIVGCLSAYFRSDETAKELACIGENRTGLLAEVKDLMEDAEISSMYLPTQVSKRPKLSELISLDVDIPFDRVGLTRVYDELKFMLECIEGDNEKLLESLESVAQSGSIESLEELLNWCLAKNVASQALGIMKLLELLAVNVINREKGSDGVDIRKFAKLYRGMSIFALAQQQSQIDGPALAYYQQALEIIKLYKEQYPEEEACWLAVSSYTHAVRISTMNAEKARAWCELSLGLLHHTGKFRSRYETAIREGYSRILDRISSSTQ